jgi:cytochrome b561
MAWKSSDDQYGSVAIAIHWISAAAILGLFALGFTAANTGDPALRAAVLRGHVPLGILVLVLTVLRIGWWMFADRRPAPLAGLPGWQAASERLIRTLIYLVLLVTAASGLGLLIISGAAPILFGGAPGPLPAFGSFPPLTVHVAGAVALLVLAGIHIAAALYHHAWRRDRLLARMGLGSATAGR